jgi:predicted HTH transcriptional regulator
MAGLFGELQKNGEVAIECWIKEGHGESLYFDCKGKTDPKKSKLDREDRKNLGKALSAFANSDGGLLLWGVDARDKNGVDCLVGKKPIVQIAAFRSSVEHAIADVISPPIPGLEFHEIPCSQAEGAGYLAISVSSSERRPHMSRDNTAPGFYSRSGHKSVLMEPFQVRDQMLRRAVPKIEFDWDMRVRRGDLSRASTAVPVSLADLEK